MSARQRLERELKRHQPGAALAGVYGGLLELYEAEHRNEVLAEAAELLIGEQDFLNGSFDSAQRAHDMLLAERTATPAQPPKSLSAAQFNQLYPVGTPVIAYPGARPDDPDAVLFDTTPLVTRTRSAAWTLGGGEPVVAVDGHTGGIGLDHIDLQEQP